MTAIALIVCNLDKTPLGVPARLSDQLHGQNILQHTLTRVDRITGLDRIVIVHPDNQNPQPLLGDSQMRTPVSCFAATGMDEPKDKHWASARKWALTCWRGGLGSATAYDELLPAGPLSQAMQAHDADTALLVRAEWCFFDTELAQAQLDRHLEEPEAYKLAFTQAPPGLSAVVCNKDVLSQFAQHHAGFGKALGYNPRHPHVDPIGREVNIAVPASVRDTFRRFIYDMPRSAEHMQAIADLLGDELDTADAAAITRTSKQVDAANPDGPWQRLPQQVTLELTPRREVAGPITPQHYVQFDRQDMDVDLAKRIVAQLGETGDIVLTLGGLGDALLHPHWQEIVTAAHDAGVLGICIETDLLCDEQTLDAILALPVDVLSIRLNADRSATYHQVMGEDRFGQVARNLQYLFDARKERDATGLPWIVPRLIKTEDTLGDLESFFDRWVLASGHAMIEPARTGCGLMPDLGPMPMAPPRRRPCRQLANRMSILSNGQVALCDQDWQGSASLGDTRIASLLEIWQVSKAPTSVHREQRYAELSLCSKCTEWHRP